ncbi:MAG TPA: sigma-70 family RNA polymerase sigma factor [Aquihabitans sp.]|nr:sigma-70 family RNA polymerase sigma factor [Aquihabitans sp.]
MDDARWGTSHFEEHRPRLRAVAYRMLGSLAEADDAVQEAWIRFSRTDTDDVENVGAWLTTVVGRVSLNVLRNRASRPADSLDVRQAEPVVGPADGLDPEQEALVADSVGLALLVVLERLTPAERLAFVLHDVFAVPFEEIGPMVDRTPTAARQLASRARRRVREVAPTPDPDPAAQRAVVDAFFAAARGGSFEQLVAVLHPDVALRVDAGPAAPAAAGGTYAGAEVVAGRAIMFASPARAAVPVTVNGAAGVVIVARGRPVSVMGFTVVDGRVAAIDVVADPDRLAGLDPGLWSDAGPPG